MFILSIWSNAQLKKKESFFVRGLWVILRLKHKYIKKIGFYYFVKYSKETQVLTELNINAITFPSGHSGGFASGFQWARILPSAFWGVWTKLHLPNVAKTLFPVTKRNGKKWFTLICHLWKVWET